MGNWYDSPFVMALCACCAGRWRVSVREFVGVQICEKLVARDAEDAVLFQTFLASVNEVEVALGITQSCGRTVAHVRLFPGVEGPDGFFYFPVVQPQSTRNAVPVTMCDSALAR